MDEKQYCVKLSVNPSRGLVDEKFVILVQHAPPGSELTVHAFQQSEDGHGWDAFAHYISDATGRVNVSEDCSLGGTYSGIEPMGLLWSLRPVPGSKPGLRLRKKNVQEPMLVTVSVYEGHRKEGFADLVPLASVLVERWYMAPGVRRIPVTEGGLTATLFLPPGPGPFPAVMDLWGGGGQLVEYRTVLLASHGIAALTIDYLTTKITKETGKLVNLQYFETAYRFLQEHPQILGSRIAMLGISVGSSMALKMAAYSEVMKLRCVVCINGTHVQPVDKDIEGMIKAMMDNASKIRINEENQTILREMVPPITSDPLKKVDVGRLQCPLMLIVGEDDMSCTSQESAVDMKEMMERAGNSHLLIILSYPDAGHLIEPPYTPLTRASNFIPYNSRTSIMVLWGGQPVAHSRAQEDSWKKMLLFLRVNLFGGTRPGAAPLSHL
ncbi:peroxisomal succinyl-coenzyme A thioesterase-like [Salarias fasciatus]|uniref:peroxisomal succinyl-coenzyme A thioesterase-like n=1 Tax=Salarias fasciatus TaxID=181472 RepID=UPI001176CCD1|nr:peroxisomal succinyl-coenzyme A thioesterase-like [Salarias fasciatus]